MESLRELFITHGLSVDAASFAEGLAWEHLLEKGAEKVVEAIKEVPEFMIEAVESTAEYGEQVDLLSTKLGVSVEQLEKFSYAAGLSGSSADDLRIAMTHLARTTEAAKDGNEEAVKVFGKLGISLDSIKNKSPDEVMMASSCRRPGWTRA